MAGGIWVDENTLEPVGRKNKHKENVIKIAKPAKFSPDIGNTKCCQYDDCNYTFTKFNTLCYHKTAGFAYSHRSDHHKGSRKGDGTPLAQTVVASKAKNTDLFNKLYALKFPE